MRSMKLAVPVVLSFLLLAVPARADEPNRVISVTGQGQVSAPPDMATIQTGVVTEAPTAQEALTANNRAMEQVIGVLEDQDIEARDIQTTDFSVSPVYRRNGDEQKALQQQVQKRPDDRGPPKIVAYRVRNQVRVRVKELSELGNVLDALVQAGSNEISGISFGVEEPEPLLDTARRRAMENAKRRARTYAEAAGVEVGPVRTISEQPVDVPRPMRLEMAAARGAAGVPVETGEQEFQVTVHVVFDLVAARRAEPDR